MSENAGRAVPSEALLAGREIAWSRYEAELRGMCDYCKRERVLLSYNGHGLWNCFACFTNIDSPANAPLERLARSDNTLGGVVGNSGGGQ